MCPDAFAQGVTTPAINGRVTGKNGEALPGVNVRRSILQRTLYGTSTREDGRYNLPNLRVGGPYTVTASLVGYQKEIREQVTPALPEPRHQLHSMEQEAVQAREVVVHGERSSVFNASRTGAATNVPRDQIDRLPQPCHGISRITTRLSPYITGDKGNALGRNSKYNNIQIDGTNFNDLFGLGSTGAPAGQSNVTPISLDAIEEFQIVVSPYDVRQSGFTGAGDQRHHAERNQ